LPDPVHIAANQVDLSARFKLSTAVVGSPAAGAETIICQVAIPNDLAVATGIILNGWAAYTIGASGVSCQLRVRQTNVAGAIIANTGVQTGGHSTAGQLVSDDVNGIDASPVLPGQVYVLTLQVGSGAGVSTVSATYLQATVV
jgi:hypothetical protein